MPSVVSVKCEVLKYKLLFLVRLKTLEGYMWEGTFEKDKVFDLTGTPNESMPIKGRVYASLITHTSVYANIEMPVEDKKIGKRINIPLNYIWPLPS